MNENELVARNLRDEIGVAKSELEHETDPSIIKVLQSIIKGCEKSLVQLESQNVT
jgi:hypothetical protein